MNAKKNFALCIIPILFLIFCTDVSCSDGPLLPNNNQKKADIVSGIEIHIKKNGEDASVYEEMARNLISIEINQPFNNEKFQESLEALKLCNKFNEINVETEEKPEKIILKFYLTPFKYIRNIHIEGSAPLFEKEVLNATTIYVGDVFNEKKVKDQAALVEALYKKEGFYSPRININWQQIPSDESYIIFINIERGAYYRSDKLEIHGNQCINDFHLKMRTTTFRTKLYIGSAGRFIENNLKEDIKKIKAFYWEKKYYEADLNYKLNKHPSKNKIDIDIYINEGPEYDVHFEGNEKFNGWWTLKRALAFKDMGNLNNSGLRKSIKNIQKKYYDAGYPDTKIRIQEQIKKLKGCQKKELTLKIKEGKRLKISEIQITGNEKLSTKKIKKQMLSGKKPLFHSWLYNPEMINEDLYAIKSLYLKYGFPDAKIEKKEVNDETGLEKKLIITITEGSQVLVRSIKTSGNIEIEEKKIKKELHHKLGKPLHKYMIKSDENTISAIVSEKGYPHVTVTSNVTLENDGKDAHLIFKITEGPSIKMGKTYYSGNFRTREKVLSNAIDIEEGAPFSLVGMLEGQRNIRNLGIFDSVRFKTIGLKEKKETIHLFAQLEEKKPYYLQFGGGYESDRGLFLETATGDHNFLGTGRDISISTEISQIGYKGELTLKDPRFLGSNISSEFNIFSKKEEEFHQNFGIREQGASIGFRSNFRKNFTAGLDFGFKQKDTYKRDSDDDSLPENENNDDDIQYEKRTAFTVSPSISYDTRNSFIRPQKGVYIFLTPEVSKGIDNSVDDFIKYRSDIRYFQKLSKRITLAGIIRFGYVDPYGSSDKVPDDELFFMGGIGDIRGYKENMLEYDDSGESIGGRFSSQGSIEARIYIGFNFELTAFYDAGKLSYLDNETEEGDIMTSTGAGLRYLTPIGPIGLMYGYKLDKRIDEAPDRWHFSMGYSF